MSFGAVFVGIEQEIIYYRQNDKIPGNLSASSLADINISSQIQTLSESVEQYEVHPNALIIQNIIESNNDSIHNNMAIGLSFDDPQDENNWNLYCRSKFDIVIALIVEHASDNDDIHPQIQSIFDSMYICIQQYFIESTQLPLYILRLRCHLLSDKLLFLANHPSCDKQCICCNLSSSYHTEPTSNKNILEAHFEQQQEEELELQRIKEVHEAQKQAAAEEAEQKQKRKQERKKKTQKKSGAPLFEPRAADGGASGASGGCIMDILDTAGQEEFSSMYEQYMREGDAFLMVYSIVSYPSFEFIKEKYNTLMRVREGVEMNTAIVLVANKCDLEQQREVQREEGEQLAQLWDSPFFEASAKQKINVHAAFEQCAREIGVKCVKYGPIREAKIVILGSGAVGKTSMTTRYVCDAFLDEYDPTIEDSYRKMIQIDGGIPSGAKFQQAAMAKGGFQLPSLSMPDFERKKKEKEEKIPKLIDDVFGDLENMFYLLSDLVYLVMMKTMDSFCDCILNMFRFIAWFIVYPLVFVLSMIVILPSCIFLLIVRMSKIESDTKQVAIRQDIIEKESCMKRSIRLINQLFRALFMFSVLAIYPLIIVYVIIPAYGDSDSVVLSAIGSYLFLILALQIFGTYRGLKSFYEKHKHTKIDGKNSEFKPQKFLWNIGSLWAVLMVIYEVNQMALFAFHTINQEEEEDTHTDAMIQLENEKLIALNNKLKSFFESVSFFAASNLQKIPVLEYYLVFGFCCVSILILFFMLRFIYELRTYAIYKRIECDMEKARTYYFYSFVGTIIYGHGRLQNVHKLSAKIVSLISDAAFLGICEKLILILVCDPSEDASLLILDGETVCWQTKHQHYAAISLILIGFYIPLSTMIAPMFDEVPAADDDDADEEEDDDDESQEEDLDPNSTKAKIKRFASMENCVDFVKPFISAVTVTKCFMLIGATFLSKGSVIGTIICDSVSCLVLLIFTVRWTFGNLNKYGLTQNEPGFPFGVSLIRGLGFFAGIIGCVVEILKVSKVIDSTIDFILLFMIIIVASIGLLWILWKYHKKFNKYDDDIDVNLLIGYNVRQKKIEIVRNIESDNVKL